MSDSKPTMTIKPNGPLLVKDLQILEGADGKLLPPKKMAALCRCGGTNTRPYCDGTHAKIDFQDTKDDARVPDKLDAYKGKQITILDNRGLCSHAGHCTDNLPEVFRMGVEPWIDPDGAPVERIMEVVRMCPSGALNFRLEDKPETGDVEREAAIRVSAHGPLRLQGGVGLMGADTLEGASEEHRTLCRCGHSKNKPYCDGSHWYANFRDDGRYRVAMKGELKDGELVTVTVDDVALTVTLEGEAVTVRVKQSGREVDCVVDDRWGEVLVLLADVRDVGSDTII